MNFFSNETLGRLRPVSTGVSRSHTKPILFYLSHFDSELKLNVVGIPDDPSEMSEQDSLVVNEMKRIHSAGRAGFENLWATGYVSPVEIRKYPYLLQMLKGNPNFHGFNSLPMEWSDATLTITLHLEEAEPGWIEPRLVMSVGDTILDSPVFLTDNTVCDSNIIYNIPSVGNNFESIDEVLKKFEASLLEAYLSFFLSYFDNITPVYKGHKAHYTTAVEKSVPTLVLEKVAPDQALYLRVTRTLESAGEGFGTLLPLTRSASVSDDGAIMVRDVDNPDISELTDKLEQTIRKSAPDRAARAEVFRDGNFFIVPATTASPFLVKHLHEVLRDFRLLGSDKLKEYKVIPVFPKLKLRLSSGIDFLEGDAEVEMGEDRLSLSDLLAQYNRNKYVTLSDGNRAIIDEKYMARLQRLFDTRDKQDHIRVSFFDLPEVEDLINDRISGDLATHARDVFEGFNKLKGKQPVGIDVRADLRKYQQDGVVWLEYLYDNNLGGCLADDMGLGKTLQTISLLTRIYPEAKQPTLVVMPRSLLFNWENELAKFAPDLKVAIYYGPSRDLKACLDAQVVLTTYAVVRNDIEELMKTQFECVVLDESQNIKNTASQVSKAVTLLNAKHRFALSGTPMENNLTEIYSLFRFLNPAMFGSLETFNSRYTYPIQKNGDPEAMRSLRRKIYPFLLRRVKKEVLTELPDRIEQDIFVEMSDAQKAYYEKRRVTLKNEIDTAIRSEGVAKAQFIMFQALNELRRIASVPESMTDGRITSPKIDELIDSLGSAVSNGHKCVVFFNYIAGLELVGARLDQMGIKYETMTGSTSATARKKIVEKFQTDPDCQVLLMTLKVGGVGLNLTAADMVYIFEPWWNKAAEEQAINRLHRIGQKATVNALSIITVGTIEEKIRLLQQQKTELFNQLIGSDSASTKQLTEEDIDFILS